MLFFISDSHFGHENIIKFCNRPYSSAEEMDNAIVKNINDTVGEQDELWWLGDFGMKPSYKQGITTQDAVLYYMNQVKCTNNHYILGNHDKQFGEKARRCFKSVQDSKLLRYENQEMYLLHYPVLDWVGAHRGTWMLHGHCHNTLKYPKMLQDKKILDVGVDSCYYRPISFIELQEKMKNKVNINYDIYGKE